MRSARLVYWSALAFGALSVACADAASPTVSMLDVLFAELDDTWISSTNPVSVTPGVTHLTNRPSASTCAYEAAAGQFVCPARTQLGLTSSTTVQLLDGGGVPQSTFVNGATSAIRVITDVSGTLPSAGVVITSVAAHSDEVVSGLISGLHTLNGTLTTTFVSVSATATLTSSAVETTSDLVLAFRGDDTPYPASGSVTTRIFSGLPVGGALLATTTSTFNGSRMVTLVVLTNGVTLTCTIDLKGVTAMSCS